MSLDRSLKTAGNLSRHRNVLSRAERIAKLQEKSKFGESQSPIGLPKVGHRKAVAKATPKKEAAADAATPAAATPAAKATKAAPAAKKK